MTKRPLFLQRPFSCLQNMCRSRQQSGQHAALKYHTQSEEQSGRYKSGISGSFFVSMRRFTKAGETASETKDPECQKSRDPQQRRDPIQQDGRQKTNHSEDSKKTADAEGQQNSSEQK